ncbi:MAG: hypothetical protein IRZ20_09400 [Thermoleophilia bacterium]|nr:hypothetical protein [Thermoleophilia bacterium]
MVAAAPTSPASGRGLGLVGPAAVDVALVWGTSQVAATVPVLAGALAARLRRRRV